MKTGLFITIEGIEGAGKSTAISVLTEYFELHKLDAVVTREPGGTEIAEKIRQVLLQHYDEKMAADTELLLNYAARAQHTATVIRPALSQGKIVLSDRFSDASFVYQGMGRGIPEKRISELDQWVLQDLQPDLTILFDIPVKLGLQRAKGRGELDRYEIEKIEFFERVRQGYLKRAKKLKDRYRVIDSTASQEMVKTQLLSLLKTFIEK